MNVLIIGGSGFLGTYLQKKLSSHMVTTTGFTRQQNSVFFDITNPDTDFLKKNQFDVIISSVAEKSHGAYCATAADGFLKGHEILCRHCNDTGALLFFISTDAVFDGKKGNYSESDIRKPVTEYGVYKTRCEDLIVSAECRSVIWRNGKIDGFFRRDNPTQMQIFYEKACREEPVTLFTNVFNSRVSVMNLSDAISEAIEKKLEGVFHFGAKSRISFYDYFQMMAKFFDFSDRFFIPAERQNFSDTSLCINKISSHLNVPILSHEEHLKVIQLSENEWKK